MDESWCPHCHIKSALMTSAKCSPSYRCEQYEPEPPVDSSGQWEAAIPFRDSDVLSPAFWDNVAHYDHPSDSVSLVENEVLSIMFASKNALLISM